MFSSPSTTLLIVRDGKVRLPAVASPTRDRNAPEAPSLAESGLPDFSQAMRHSIDTAALCNAQSGSVVEGQEDALRKTNSRCSDRKRTSLSVDAEALQFALLSLRGDDRVISK